MKKSLKTLFGMALMLLFFALSGLTAKGQSSSGNFKVGITVGDLANPFFYTMGKGAEAKIKELDSDASLTLLSSSYDLSKQVSQMDNFIANGTKLIILNAADTQGIGPAVRKARQAGVVVIAVDVGAEGGVDATVTSDNYQAGVIPAQFLAERIGGKGNVVIINGPPVTAVIDRVQGAKDVFAKYPDIRVLSDNQNAGGSRDGGLEVMSNLLTSFQEIDAVFAINDPTGIGAELAIKQAGREGEMFVVGVDGSPDAVVALKDPDSIFLATAAQDPKGMTERAVEIGYNLAAKQQKPENELIKMPVTLVTKDNVASFEGWSVPK